MKTIRINETAYKALEAEAIKQDRSLSWMVSDLVLKSIKAQQVISEEPKEEYKTKKKKKPVHPLFNELKDIWFEYWQKYNKYEFTSWGVMHATALNQLITKIEKLDKTGNTKDVFITLMDKLPDFYKDKFITTLNKNFDGIISQIRSSKASSMEEIRKHYGF